MAIDRTALLALMLLVNGAAPGAGITNGGSDAERMPEATNESDATSPMDIRALALKTLGSYLSRPVEEIDLVSVTPIDWPDSSLGCPRPDRSYLQVITPGHYAVLKHGEASYRVHLAKGRAFVCDRPLSGGSLDKQLTPQLAVPLEHLQTIARSDLARRLQVPADQVKSTQARPVVWRDASLGCPAADQTYKPAAINGYVLELSYHGRTYTYHSDTRRVFPCPAFEAQ
jgi:hypothetical protein